MKKYFIIIITILASTNIFPDYIQYFPENSIGFIYLTGTENNWNETIHVVRETKIGILNNNSKKIGYLYFPKCDYATDECWNNTITVGSKVFPLLVEDFVSIAYDGYCLQYYEKRGEYIRIAEKSYKEGIWISIELLRKKGFSLMDFKSLILQKYNKASFFPIQNLNLRSTPDKSSPLVIMITNDKHAIRLTGKFKGNWAEVIVYEYDLKEDSNGEPKIIKKFKGWCKIFDDKQFPNIWLATKDENNGV